MAFPIEQKLVIAVSSSALFDLRSSEKVFSKGGPAAYKVYQEKNQEHVFDKGVAFPFIKRFLSLNKRFAAQQPVEVILLSRNSAATGRRIFKSIQHYGLDISRAAFMDGKSPYEYIPAFNASIFLSANEQDVQHAIDAGYPAGTVLPAAAIHDDTDGELRIAFDFDGVIADDESETVYNKGHLQAFHSYEVSNSHIPHQPGPLADLFKKLSVIQELEDKEFEQDHNYQRIIRTALITARNAPAHERVITTLESWGVSANETFFLGGMLKDRILSTLKPHIYFDDQRHHLTPGDSDIPLVHVPFGVANKTEEKAETSLREVGNG